MPLRAVARGCDPAHYGGPVTSAAGTGRRRQDAIYRAGVYGRRPRVPTVYRALAREAKSRLDARAYGYVAGGAGAEDTQRADRAAFDRWVVVPRVLCDVSDVRASAMLL